MRLAKRLVSALFLPCQTCKKQIDKAMSTSPMAIRKGALTRACEGSQLGMTPLMMAVSRRNDVAVRELLRFHADLQLLCVDAEGNTPLLLALKYNHNHNHNHDQNTEDERSRSIVEHILSFVDSDDDNERATAKQALRMPDKHGLMPMVAAIDTDQHLLDRVLDCMSDDAIVASLPPDMCVVCEGKGFYFVDDSRAYDVYPVLSTRGSLLRNVVAFEAEAA